MGLPWVWLTYPGEHGWRNASAFLSILAASFLIRGGALCPLPLRHSGNLSTLNLCRSCAVLFQCLCVHMCDIRALTFFTDVLWFIRWKKTSLPLSCCWSVFYPSNRKEHLQSRFLLLLPSRLPSPLFSPSLPSPFFTTFSSSPSSSSSFCSSFLSTR